MLDTTYPTDLDRDILIRDLRETHERRKALMLEINLEELWELVSEENATSFDPAFLAELSIGEAATDDMVAAFLRCVFADRLFFKYREGMIKVHSAEQVEQIRLQLEKERQEAELIENGAQAISALMDTDPGNADGPLAGRMPRHHPRLLSLRQ